MSQREFVNRKVRHGDKVIPSMFIECKCGTGMHFKQTGATRKPPEAAEQYFRRNGWTIGARPNGDRCPVCTLRTPKAETMEKPAATPAVAEPTREERRIVFLKIDEHYESEKVGYRAPWTDAAIARDLNVPRDWVAKVRDEHFGPGGSNADFDAFLEQVAPILADLKNLARSTAAQLEEARKIGERVDDIERLAKRIEREIGRA
ncbi:MAG TPA: hypothetical protein VGV39_04750 [Mesorhizobium sp.]|jgi:hypothetical protein|uniref:hypothetical protein n=1 Tax=Mesorhizobium sp. TaxID=1871066 RepID=UPI002DDD776C|nr:hypothetical protein [Mesorhizobium sp.]HEV2502358.1 hypothetical protein [Mesorhizobium sp.]